MRLEEKVCGSQHPCEDRAQTRGNVVLSETRARGLLQALRGDPGV